MPGLEVEGAAGVKRVAFCSFGADSTANVLLGMKHGERPDEIVYCEVMFDKRTSGEIPEHRDFVYEKAIPFFKREGIKTNVVRGEKTFVELFCKKIGERGAEYNRGKIWAWPLCGRCYVQRDCKVRPMNLFERTAWGKEEIVKLSGIAADEEARLLTMLGYGGTSLLEKHGVTQAGARYMCKHAGLLSPCYEFTDRNGCFFCPNSKWRERRHLYDHHPDLWERLLKLQKLPNKSTNRFDRTYTIDEIDAMFRLEDAQYDLLSDRPVIPYESLF